MNSTGEEQGQAATPGNAFRMAVRRSLANGDSRNLHLHFDVGVLERYRKADGFSLVRTDTVGRVKREGGWSLDFGITPDEQMLHASVGDLMAIPEAERAHWASFAVSLPVSRTFIQMRLSRGSCFEDGKVRQWWV